ncbi:hypothetical protein NRB20_34720 [Nocardia sp. RB20]|uniref:Prolyl aminopeptidase n=1 Tax=Nocardia macrotermitis TaxID=2585198 RepID=A0A7K0D3W0_9NOCA|nr:hypothetical protein [Nocardia macrotermitis]
METGCTGAPAAIPRADQRWWCTVGRAARLSGIPGDLIHGRLDLSAPLETAWDLAKAWPDARLHIIEDSGHTGSPTMAAAITHAIARFAQPDTDHP